MENLIFFGMSLTYIAIMIAVAYFSYQLGAKSKEVEEEETLVELERKIMPTPMTAKEIKEAEDAAENAQNMAKQAMAMMGFRGLEEAPEDD